MRPPRKCFPCPKSAIPNPFRKSKGPNDLIEFDLSLVIHAKCVPLINEYRCDVRSNRCSLHIFLQPFSETSRLRFITTCSHRNFLPFEVVEQLRVLRGRHCDRVLLLAEPNLRSLPDTSFIFEVAFACPSWQRHRIRLPSAHLRASMNPYILLRYDTISGCVQFTGPMNLRRTTPWRSMM